VSVDVTPDLKLQVTLELDLLAEAKDLARKSNKPAIETVIDWISKALEQKQLHNYA
jgi:hypothetical protein